MTSSVGGAPAAFMVIDMVTGEAEPGLTWAGGQNLTPVKYSADNRYAYVVVRTPGEEPGTYEDFFIGIDTDVMEGGGGSLHGTPRGSIQLSADGTMAYLLMDHYIDYASPFGDPGGSRPLEVTFTSDLLLSDDDRFGYATSYWPEFDEHYLSVIDTIEDSAIHIFVPTQLNRPILSADGTRVFGTTTTRIDGDEYEHSFVIVDIASETVQSIVLPGNVFDTITLSQDQSQVYALSASTTTGDDLTYLLSIDDVPKPPIVLPSVVGIPQGSAVVGASGYGYHVVYDENTNATTVLVAKPDGHVTVAGSVSGNPAEDSDVAPEIITLSGGGIAFVTSDSSGPGDPVTRLVTVSEDGVVTTDVTGQAGRWLHADNGTHFYLALVENEIDIALEVWRLAPEGGVHFHSKGYGGEVEGNGAVIGPDGTLYLGVNQHAPVSSFNSRASVWVISPSGGETIYVLGSLTGTEVTDYSSVDGIALTAGGTVYLLAMAAGLEDGIPNQAVGVLVVGANGSVSRVHIPSVPAGATNIVAAGDYGVFVWYDRTSTWVSVIDSSGNRVDHPHPGGTGVFVAAADGSAAYSPVDGETLLYVSSSGDVSTLEVGPYDGDILTGPGGAMYLIDPSGGRLITVTGGVVSTATLGNGTSFDGASLEFASDGTPFVLLRNGDDMRLAVPTAGATSPSFTFSGYPDVQFEVIGDTAYIVVPNHDAAQVFAIDSSGTTVFTGMLAPAAGQVAGPIEIGADGTLYYTVYEEMPGGTATTHVFATNAQGTTEVFTAPGAPPSIWGSSQAAGVVVGPDGTLYVSITTIQPYPEAVVTTVHVVPVKSTL
jgi:hypothetical protein